jgi:hypothetical protein
LATVGPMAGPVTDTGAGHFVLRIWSRRGDSNS